MHIAKRIQSILRRPKRDSESSETDTMTEIKVAPETAVPRVEAVSIPSLILSDENGGGITPVHQMEPQPMEEDSPPGFTIERPPSPYRMEEEGEEEEDGPILLAPAVMLDPNLPSILNPPTEKRTPSATPKKGGSPQTIRFELAEAPERSNPNYRRLSAVSSSQWRIMPFGLSNGGSSLLRPNIPLAPPTIPPAAINSIIPPGITANTPTPPTTDLHADGIPNLPTGIATSLPGGINRLPGGDTLGMSQSDHSNPFLGAWFGSGFPGPGGLMMESEVAGIVSPDVFIDDNRPELIRDLSGEVRQIGLHAAYEGSYSNVFKGMWGRTLVSIKVIRGVGVSETMLAKVRAQREEWWHLSHPNVLSLYGFCDEFGSYGASISPWLKNGNASIHLRRNPVTPSERFRLWCDVVDGIDYLHSRNPPVVHGDLKPANVMMDDDGAGVLCDFGLVHIISDEVATGMTTTTNQTGTVRYLACELVNSDDMPDPTTASDIYALGCLGLEFLFLRTPFANRRNPAQIFKDIAMNVPPAPHIPFAGTPPAPIDLYWKLLTQCWNPDPEQRPNAHQVQEYLLQSKGDLVAILEDDFVPAPGLILDDVPVDTRSSAPVYRLLDGVIKS